jgi:hypothetical protein
MADVTLEMLQALIQRANAGIELMVKSELMGRLGHSEI